MSVSSHPEGYRPAPRWGKNAPHGRTLRLVRGKADDDYDYDYEREREREHDHDHDHDHEREQDVRNGHRQVRIRGFSRSNGPPPGKGGRFGRMP